MEVFSRVEAGGVMLLAEMERVKAELDAMMTEPCQ
jgi:hypothetical protein